MLSPIKGQWKTIQSRSDRGGKQTRLHFAEAQPIQAEDCYLPVQLSLIHIFLHDYRDRNTAIALLSLGQDREALRILEALPALSLIHI